MIKVNNSQLNYQYGDNIHVPYSIASLVSFVKSNEIIRQNFKFEKTFVFRDKFNEYLDQCIDTDILLCSCYVWNWEITCVLAKQVKKINPNCTVIFGGPQIPYDTEGFFEKYSFVDILVHGEGELILKNILDEYLNNKDYSKIKGITTRSYKNPPQERINNLDDLPSPYLTNTVWELVDKIPGINWICSWETNRGCPYLCTFCDWGSATFTVMRKYSDKKLFDEIEWFADNKIVYIECCDSNFGIFPRDIELAKKLIEQVTEKHYSSTFRTSWAKNTSEKVIRIAKTLQAGGLLTSVGLALESLDETTLNVIKRKNIKFNKFSELTHEFHSNGLPTYTEIIRGLPGETLESYKNGLEMLVADTVIGSIYIYNCTVLPNAPLNEPAYRKLHKIEDICSPIYLAHSSIHHRGIEEYDYIITSTSSFSLDDLKQMYLFSWMTLILHNLGILEYVSKYYNKEHGIQYMKFYETFLDFCRHSNSVFSNVYKITTKYIDDGYSGKGWNFHDPDLGDIFWPIEEATWLMLVSENQKLIDEINSFVQFFENKHDFKTPNDIIKDLSRFQVFLLTTKDDKREFKSESFKYNWKDYFSNKSELRLFNIEYSYKNKVLENNPFEWNIKTIWYGRRSQKYKQDLSSIITGFCSQEGPIIV